MDFRKLGRPLSYALAAAAVFIWSVTFISTKYLLGYLEPGEILFYRVAIAYAAFLIAGLKSARLSNLNDELKMGSAGVLGVTCFFLFENIALSYSAASNVVLLVCTSPFWTGVGAHFFSRGERFTKDFALGSLLCITGIFLIVFNGHFVLKLSPLGDLLALCSAASFAAYSIVVRGVLDRYTPVQTARKTLFYALLSLFALSFTPMLNLHFEQLARPAVAANLLFLALIDTTFCTWAWNIVIWNLGAAKANNLIYITPPLTMLLSAIILGEQITLYAITGGALILSGVYVSQRIRR